MDAPDTVIEEIQQGRTVTPQASPKPKGKLIAVPSNKPERTTPRSFGVEDQARRNKKRKTSVTKKSSYRPHVSADFSASSTQSLGSAAKPKAVSTASFYGSAPENSFNSNGRNYSRSPGKYGPRQSVNDGHKYQFTNNFLVSFKNKEKKEEKQNQKIINFEKRQVTREQKTGKKDCATEVISLDDEIEEISDDDEGILKKI
jgi:hypothetical protein